MMTGIRTVRFAVLIVLFLGTAVAQTATARIVTAANAFLASLDEKQRQSVQFTFDDEEQRKRWSNLPISIVPRAGLSFKDMTPTQRTAGLALLSAALSKRGYEKVQQIVEADEVLKAGEANRAPAGGRGGNRLMFGSDLYYFSILGKPSETTPWMLQFGGHHLGLNITVSGAQGVLTPSMVGAQPAMYTANGKTIRPLGQESDKALALLNALDENQKKQAILGFRLVDLVLGPGQDGKIIQPEGLKASAMNDKQRAMLLDVMSEWVDIVHDQAAATRLAELKREMNDTWFAWSGPTTAASGNNITAYYRIQGPHVVIEYAPQQMGGDAALHLHTMYRDPTNDYGRKPAVK